MTSIELRDLHKRFGSVAAVAGVSLTVHEGELLALVGPSGCGKTTLLRLIAGFERPDSGNILLNNRSVLGLEPEKRGVGIVFQDYALFPHMNVADNIAYGLKFVPLSRPERRARMDKLLHLIGLEALERRLPHELSAGQQQRVALARALAPRPRVLLLDEPLSALDVQLREELRLEIRRLQREFAITTIHVTHDQEEALAIADRVAVMNAGRLEQVAPSRELYQHPQTEFVARFIGRGNLLSGVVVQSESGELTIQLEELGTVHLSRNSRPLPVGQRITLLIRPEQMALDNARANRLNGIIEGLEFLGEICRLHVRCGAQSLIVQVPSGEAEPWQRKIEQTVTLSFEPKDIWVVPSC
jgi:ABC-type Fe3+/spermidine/putrescine transport system ATPase subunit